MNAASEGAPGLPGLAVLRLLTAHERDEHQRHDGGHGLQQVLEQQQAPLNTKMRGGGGGGGREAVVEEREGVGPKSSCTKNGLTRFSRWYPARVTLVWRGGGGGGAGGVSQGCIRRERASEAAPEAVRQAVGGGRQSGWGRLLSVTKAVEAGTWRQGDSGWA